MSYTCLIVEDEVLLAGVIKTYLAHFPELELIGICKNPIEARQVLQEQTIDLLFLDIHMPHMSGLDFLKSLTNPPAVIFTTAYGEYALDGFEMSAVDYLLKPIKMDRFMKAVDKFLQSQSKPKIQVSQAAEESSEPVITFRADKKWIRLPYSSISHIEGEREYVKLVTHSKEKYMTLMSLNDLESNLSSEMFIRVHRSCILSKSIIKMLDGNMIKTASGDFKLGASYKPAFMDWFLV